MPGDDWTEGILDNASIRGAIDFAEQWHSGEWAIATLPRDLGVKVRLREVDPSSLGACVEIGGRRGIALNELIVGTRGHLPTLAHECGHLFQPAEDVGFCRSSIQLSRREREAWWIAAILAVPRTAIQPVRLFGDEASAVAGQLGVPRAMVTMRICLAMLFGEIQSRQAPFARPMLETATIAQQIWVARFSQRLAGRA